MAVEVVDRVDSAEAKHLIADAEDCVRTTIDRQWRQVRRRVLSDAKRQIADDVAAHGANDKLLDNINPDDIARDAMTKLGVRVNQKLL